MMPQRHQPELWLLPFLVLVLVRLLVWVMPPQQQNQMVLVWWEVVLPSLER